MQLKLETDYAIRILVYLAKKNKVASAKELSSILTIPISGVPKIARKLCQKGWLTSETGTTGGYYLCVNPNDISMLDVMETMESHIKINRCLEPDRPCVCNEEGTCMMHQVYEEYQKVMEQYFSRIRINDLLTSEIIKKIKKQI